MKVRQLVTVFSRSLLGSLLLHWGGGERLAVLSARAADDPKVQVQPAPIRRSTSRFSKWPPRI